MTIIRCQSSMIDLYESSINNYKSYANFDSPIILLLMFLFDFCNRYCSLHPVLIYFFLRHLSSHSYVLYKKYILVKIYSLKCILIHQLFLIPHLRDCYNLHTHF